MTALAPASKTRAPEPINIDLTLPAIPEYIPRCDLATRPRAAFTRLSQLSVAGPGPSSLISPTKIRCNNNSNSAVYSGQRFSWRTNHSALELLFQLVAVASSLRSFHKFFITHPPSQVQIWGHTRFQHIAAHQQSPDSISAHSQSS